MPVESLSPDEARTLLIRRLGAQRVADDPVTTERVISRCAGSPLELAVIAARAATVQRGDGDLS